MRIRLRTLAAGPAGIIAPNSVLDLPRADAYDLIEAGYAEQVDDGEVEHAVAADRATATAHANRRNGVR